MADDRVLSLTPAGREQIPEETLRAALDDGHARWVSFDGIDYVRFADTYHGIHRGTVILDGRVLPSFPSIGRIFVLERGIRHCLRGRFHAEEKLDGYNVRIVRRAGRDLPFTRGGFVCPFTEDRMRDLGDFDGLFAADPDLVLCGEVVGRDNPYMDSQSAHVRDDIDLYAFDLMRLDGTGPLPLEERDAAFEQHGLRHTPYLGWFTADDVPQIRDIVLRLDEMHAEGIIFKPPAGGLRLKYITPRVNVADIALDGAFLAELPAEFFLGRLLRLAIGLDELDLEERIDTAEQQVGHALISGFLPVLREVAGGGKVARTHRVRLHTDAAADRLMDHLSRASTKVQAREIERRREGEWLILEFEKTFLPSTSRLKNLLEGDYVID